MRKGRGCNYDKLKIYVVIFYTEYLAQLVERLHSVWNLWGSILVRDVAMVTATWDVPNLKHI
jgi:hypothetical protein